MTSKATNATMKECVAFRDDVTGCDCYLCTRAAIMLKREQEARQPVPVWTWLFFGAIMGTLLYIATQSQ